MTAETNSELAAAEAAVMAAEAARADLDPHDPRYWDLAAEQDDRNVAAYRQLLAVVEPRTAYWPVVYDALQYRIDRAEHARRQAARAAEKLARGVR